MRERLLAIALIASTLACGSGETEPQAGEATPARPAEEPAVPPTPEAPGEPRARDVAGLEVTVEPSGSIRIVGSDRFGGDASTVYESVEYLEGALPVLERSLTRAQVEGLRALVAELRAGAPAPP